MSELCYGIDFGASNSAVAVVKDGKALALPIDNMQAVPTLLYYSEYEQLFGYRAYRAMLRGDSGRFIRNIKTSLYLPNIDKTRIFDELRSFTSIISDYLNYIREKANRYLGQEVTKAIIGRPVHFHEDENDDKSAQYKLKKAALMAGFHKVSFAYEPVAATINDKENFRRGDIILTFDFGGSTLDLHLLEVGENGKIETIGTAGIRLGGHDITKEVFVSKILKYFGYGVTYTSKSTNRAFNPKGELKIPNILPFSIIDGNLNRDDEKIFRLISDIVWDSEDEIGELWTLETFLKERLYYKFYDIVDRSKIALSEKTREVITFKEKGANIEEEYTRKEYTDHLDIFGQKLQETFDTFLKSVEMKASSINYIVRVGGSSEIPYFLKFLQRYFGNAEIIKSDLFLGVAKGLAKIATLKNSQQYLVA